MYIVSLYSCEPCLFWSFCSNYLTIFYWIFFLLLLSYNSSDIIWKQIFGQVNLSWIYALSLCWSLCIYFYISFVYFLLMGLLKSTFYDAYFIISFSAMFSYFCILSTKYLHVWRFSPLSSFRERNLHFQDSFHCFLSLIVYVDGLSVNFTVVPMYLMCFFLWLVLGISPIF